MKQNTRILCGAMAAAMTVPLVDATTYTRGSMGGQAPDSNPPEMPGNSGDSTLSALACEGTVVDD